jgi:hypothetical protein
MKIPLFNTFLNVNFSLEPRENKLRKELSDFFETNEIEGRKVGDFELEIVNSKKGHFGKIIPNLKGYKLQGLEDNYSKEIEKIGNKYGLKDLTIVYFAYGK